MFFIEQHFDLVHGGVFGLRDTAIILTRIAEGISSDGLRDLFPGLEGEHIHEYEESDITPPGKSIGIRMRVRDAMAP